VDKFPNRHINFAQPACWDEKLTRYFGQKHLFETKEVEDRRNNLATNREEKTKMEKVTMTIIEDIDYSI